MIEEFGSGVAFNTWSRESGQVGDRGVGFKASRTRQVSAEILSYFPAPLALVHLRRSQNMNLDMSLTHSRVQYEFGCVYGT